MTGSGDSGPDTQLDGMNGAAEALPRRRKRRRSGSLTGPPAAGRGRVRRNQWRVSCAGWESRDLEGRSDGRLGGRCGQGEEGLGWGGQAGGPGWQVAAIDRAARSVRPGRRRERVLCTGGAGLGVQRRPAGCGGLACGRAGVLEESVRRTAAGTARPREPRGGRREAPPSGPGAARRALTCSTTSTSYELPLLFWWPRNLEPL